ncbi:hypothetical protein [Vibrio tasmaniensis]|uniref:hypothetical protein n=1 Tax=Vibrio tasmaniensis TaxID=212663 RepID=UPI001436AB3B|nr:hypothetical protein [Vibrio tasmaniensis]
MNDKLCNADQELSMTSYQFLITNNGLSAISYQVKALNCVLRNLDLGLTETVSKGG